MLIQTHESYITLPGSLTASQTIEPLDIYYLQNVGSIGVQFVFEKTLNIDVLKQSFTYVLCEVPALAGTFDLEKMQIVDWEAGVPFKVDINHPTKLGDISDPELGEPLRDTFLDEPSRKDLESGKAPVTSIKITNLLHGGCVLGVTISHGLLDAASFFLVMQRWSVIYRQLKSGNSYHRPNEHLISDRNLFKFGARLDMEEFLATIQANGLSKPVDMAGVDGKLLKAARKLKRHQAMKAERVAIHFTPEELANMKDKVLQQSGQENLTTRAPLYAHLANVMGDHIYANKKIKQMQITNVFNTVGIINAQTTQNKRYLGNALCAYTENLASGDNFLEASCEELAVSFESAFNSMSLHALQKHFGFVADALRLGLDYPGVDIKKPVLSFNNQSVLDVYSIDFSAGELVRVIPYEVDQQILLFPAQNGGIDAYLRVLNKRKQEELASNKLHTRLHYYRPKITARMHMFLE